MAKPCRTLTAKRCWPVCSQVLLACLQPRMRQDDMPSMEYAWEKRNKQLLLHADVSAVQAQLWEHARNSTKKNTSILSTGGLSILCLLAMQKHSGVVQRQASTEHTWWLAPAANKLSRAHSRAALCRCITQLRLNELLYGKAERKQKLSASHTTIFSTLQERSPSVPSCHRSP